MIVFFVLWLLIGATLGFVGASLLRTVDGDLSAADRFELEQRRLRDWHQGVTR